MVFQYPTLSPCVSLSLCLSLFCCCLSYCQSLCILTVSASTVHLSLCPLSLAPLLSTSLPLSPGLSPSLPLSTSFLLFACPHSLLGPGEVKSQERRSEGISLPSQSCPVPLSPTDACSCFHHGQSERSHLARPPGSHLAVPDPQFKGQGSAAPRPQAPPIPGKPAAASLPRHADLSHQGAGT